MVICSEVFTDANGFAAILHFILFYRVNCIRLFLEVFDLFRVLYMAIKYGSIWIPLHGTMQSNQHRVLKMLLSSACVSGFFIKNQVSTRV